MKLSVFRDGELFFICCALIVLYLAFWAGFINFAKLTMSLNSILEIHTYLLVIVVDILLLFIPFIVLVSLNLIRNENAELRKYNIQLKEDAINNAKFTEVIRSGSFDKYIEQHKQNHTDLYNLAVEIKRNNQKEEQGKWITKGKEIINDILRSHININELSVAVLKGVIDYMGAAQGSFFILDGDILRNVANYAYNRQRFDKLDCEVGRGLAGQVAYEKQMVYRTEVPDDYFTISSGLLDDSKPQSLVILPLLQEEELQGVIELGFLNKDLPKYRLDFADELGAMIGRTIYAQKINATTKRLLIESQDMTQTLQRNEEKLTENAKQMMQAQQELERSNQLLESKIEEVENAQKRLIALLSNASEFISIYNDKQDLVFESPSVKRILGYNDDDNVQGMDYRLVTPRGERMLNQLFSYLLETPGGEGTTTYTYLKKNGEKIYLETTGKNMLHVPAIKGLIFNTQDVTERRRAAKEEKIKSRMQSLSENSPDMIIRVNMHGKIMYANPTISEFTGLACNEVVNVRIKDLNIDENFIAFVNKAIEHTLEYRTQIMQEIELVDGEEARVLGVRAIPEMEMDNVASLLLVANDLTELKKIEQEVKEKNKKISDSINYAERIQTATLPDTKYLQGYFPNSFIFYRPKDVVSGDFPWFAENGDNLYFAAVDCTGHGVPGALLSFVGYFLLNNVVSIDNGYDAADILTQLHNRVRSTLKQNNSESNARDGMDLALCKVNKKERILHFSGAHNPLYLLRNGELIIYKATRKGVGGKPHPKIKEKEFENNQIQYQPGDKVFIFSDGMPDQLGGPDRRKFQAKRIRELLTEQSDASMDYFSRQFSRSFYNWMGDEKQIDDVLVMGVELE